VNAVRAAALGVAVMVAVMVAVLATGRSGPDRMAAHLVGQPAPPVVGTTIDGDRWDLDDQRAAGWW